LLGPMREDKTVTARFLARAQASLESIRKEIEGRAPLREKISTSVELPLAPETKRVLAYAHEESDRLQHRHIGTEHLLLGLLREERSLAAEILYERGLRLAAVREEVARATGSDTRATQKKDTPHLAEFSRDLTEDAINDKLDPLIGREHEIERVIQILCRRTKNNPVLIGEPGVGKTAPAEFRKSIEKDRSLERRFQAVKVPPPSEEEAVSILDGVRERYEAFHQVRYTEEAIEAAVYQSNRYIPDRFLPDKAIDVIDEAGARVKLRA